MVLTGPRQGDPNASIPTIEPVNMRPMFAVSSPESQIFASPPLCLRLRSPVNGGIQDICSQNIHHVCFASVHKSGNNRNLRHQEACRSGQKLPEYWKERHET